MLSKILKLRPRYPRRNSGVKTSLELRVERFAGKLALENELLT
jgi:hypothetical protein